MAVAVPAIDAALHLAQHLRDAGYAEHALRFEGVHEAVVEGDLGAAGALFEEAVTAGLLDLPLPDVEPMFTAVAHALMASTGAGR